MKLNYVRLLTKDYPTMFTFYQDKMRLECTHKNPEASYAEFKAGDITLAIFSRELMAKALDVEMAEGGIHECQDKTVIIFRSEDVDGAAAELTGRGVVLMYPPTNRSEWGIRTAHLRDPDGNVIEINGPLKE